MSALTGLRARVWVVVCGLGVCSLVAAVWVIALGAQQTSIRQEGVIGGTVQNAAGAGAQSAQKEDWRVAGRRRDTAAPTQFGEWWKPTGTGSVPYGGVIGGTVTGAQGPEAGVWVIAETNDLPTKLVKIVVTDDQGRFVLPQLPPATYALFVRGYGLVDSDPVPAAPGDLTVALRATAARTPQEAAKIYPANYWYSLLEVPKRSEFPGTGTGPGGNGIAVNIKNQGQYLAEITNGCQSHHQMGTAVTRSVAHLGTRFDSTKAAWEYRLTTGQRGNMLGPLRLIGQDRALAMFADWTDRIAAGEVPPAPPRPRGVERNVVITMWDWGVDDAFTHDIWSTDKRNPTVNAGGPIYANSAGHGKVAVVEPRRNLSYEFQLPTRDDPTTIRSRFPQALDNPSTWYPGVRHWGNSVGKRGEAHNMVMDRQERLWMSTIIRDPANPPKWCSDPSASKYAAYLPLKGDNNRQAGYHDTKTGEFVQIDTCFLTHHLNFAEDANNTVWYSGADDVVGWIETKVWDETKDERAAQGWCPIVLDTNGDGKITKPWTEPGQPIDPTRNTRIRHGNYGINPDPSDPDGSVVWIGGESPFPGGFFRLDRGTNPPETCIAEVYDVPHADSNPKVDRAHSGFLPRGGPDVTRDGVVWISLAGSGQMARFDRNKCKVLNGPTATGQQCVEGWTLYEHPGPRFKGVDEPGNADFHYFNYVDQFNTFGLGENIPFTVGTNSDSLQAQLPNGERVVLRVPYPLQAYSRGMDGRIDDPNTGWKGRGLWMAYGTHVLWHTEGGKGTRSKAVHFQLRPDPLAR